MTLFTTLLAIVVLLTFGSRLKETVSKMLDLVDSSLDVGEAHVKAMKRDAKQSAKLRSLEKKADSLQRVKRLNKKLGTDAVDLSELQDNVASDAKSAFARKPKK